MATKGRSDVDQRRKVAVLTLTWPVRGGRYIIAGLGNAPRRVREFHPPHRRYWRSPAGWSDGLERVAQALASEGYDVVFAEDPRDLFDR